MPKHWMTFALNGPNTGRFRLYITRRVYPRRGWEAVRYRGKWYRLAGGIRTDHFISV